jgi:peptide/nickel transport system substrate-binding protein
MTALYIGDERIMNYNYWGMEAHFMMFLPLVAFEGDEAGELEPRLAESWQHSDDYREWTFWLRRDVRWHDGQSTTAHDIKFTLDLYKENLMPRGIMSPYSVTLLDDYSFKIIFDEPTDALNPWIVYYPKHLLEDLDPEEFYSWEFWEHPVGNGPYRYLRHVPKTMAEYEANPDYYKGRPKIDRIVLKFGTENALTELLSGNVDVAYPSQADILKLKGNTRFRTYHWWGSWIETIHWNHKNPLFQDPVARRALTLAIDRRELSSALNHPEGIPILDVISSQKQYRNGQIPKPLPYDPGEASHLLQNLGWKDTDKDGVLEKNGREFRFTAIHASNNRFGIEKAAVFIQAQFKKIGVKMEIQPLQYGVVSRRFKNGDFDAVFDRFKNGEQGTLVQMNYFGEKSPFGYTNPELLEYLNDIKYTINPQKRDAIYQKIMLIFQKDVPLTFLLPQVQAAAAHRRIKGISNNMKWDPVWFAEYLWIVEE